MLSQSTELLKNHKNFENYIENLQRKTDSIYEKLF
jgi:hypothetical protein